MLASQCSRWFLSIGFIGVASLFLLVSRKAFDHNEVRIMQSMSPANVPAVSGAWRTALAGVGNPTTIHRSRKLSTPILSRYQHITAADPTRTRANLPTRVPTLARTAGSIIVDMASTIAFFFGLALGAFIQMLSGYFETGFFRWNRQRLGPLSTIRDGSDCTLAITNIGEVSATKFCPGWKWFQNDDSIATMGVIGERTNGNFEIGGVCRAESIEWGEGVMGGCVWCIGGVNGLCRLPFYSYPKAGACASVVSLVHTPFLSRSVMVHRLVLLVACHTPVPPKNNSLKKPP